MNARRHLQLIDPSTGEIAEDAPRYDEALAKLAELQTLIERFERRHKGDLLRIAAVEADREQRALADPLRAEVETIWRCWKPACNRRRPLHYSDRENIARAINELGMLKCLTAVAGAGFDPNYSEPRRNGHRERYDDLELIFRSYGKVEQFARRAPRDWQPDPERVAELGGQGVEWVRSRLDASSG